jgi:hypothetical protein
MMAPKRVVLDFEEALSQVFVDVFLTATVTRDFFHFVQANVKRVGQLGLKAEAKAVVSDLNLLWYANDKHVFDSRLHELWKSGSAPCPNMQLTWSARGWSDFHLSNGRPMLGLQMHRRVCSLFLHVFLVLVSLWKFDADSSAYDTDDADDVIDSVKEPTTKTFAPPMRTAPFGLPPATLSVPSGGGGQTIGRAKRAPFADQCPTCKHHKVNAACSLKLCKVCCIELPSRCALTDHKRAKTFARNKSYKETSLRTVSVEPTCFARSDTERDIAERLSEAISDKCDVYIQYESHTGKSTYRRITPTALKKQTSKGQLLEATCRLRNETRSFYVHRMKRMELFDWQQQQGRIQSLFLFLFHCFSFCFSSHFLLYGS